MNEAPTSPATATTPHSHIIAAKAKAMPDQDPIAAKQAELESEQVKVALLQEELKALKTNIAEFQQNTAGYDVEYNDFIHNRDELNKLALQKQEIADAVLNPSDITKIDKLIQDFDDNLESEGKKVEDAEKNSDSSRLAAETANTLLQSNHDVYENLKTSLKNAKTKLAGIKSLIDQANQMEAKGNYVVLHFLAKEASTMLSSKDITDIVSADKFPGKLKDAQEAAETARKAFAQKQSEAKQASDAFKAIGQKHDTALASRRAELLKSLAEFKQTGV